MRIKLLERDIQKQITDWLSLKGYFWYRQNSARFFPSYKGKRRAIRAGVPGIADLTVVINGFHVAIEVKKPGERQTTDQEIFQNNLEIRGKGMYVVARSLEDVINYLRSRGL